MNWQILWHEDVRQAMRRGCTRSKHGGMKERSCCSRLVMMMMMIRCEVMCCISRCRCCLVLWMSNPNCVTSHRQVPRQSLRWRLFRVRVKTYGLVRLQTVHTESRLQDLWSHLSTDSTHRVKTYGLVHLQTVQTESRLQDLWSHLSTDSTHRVKTYGLVRLQTAHTESRLQDFGLICLQTAHSESRLMVSSIYRQHTQSQDFKTLVSFVYRQHTQDMSQCHSHHMSQWLRCDWQMASQRKQNTYNIKTKK